MRRKFGVRPRAELKIDTYRLIDRCVEEGIETGWRRAHKYTDTPTETQIKQEINSAIMSQMSEIFRFSETY